jgi:uncharacterized membrane protein
MAFCSKCGSSLAEGAAFCPQCGAPVAATAAPPAQEWVAAPPPGAAAPARGLQENVAGLLCYLLGWITGIIFLLIDKRPFVRFHAAQSVVVFGALNILRAVLVFGIFGPRSFGLFSIWSLISMLLSLITFAAWLILMIYAYQGKRVEVPIAAGIAKSIAGRMPVARSTPL